MPVDAIAVFLAAFLSLILPISILAVRQTVKTQRQQVIKDLARLFDADGAAQCGRSIPSFEFVKFKYFLDEPDLTKSKQQRRSSRDFSVLMFVIASAPLILVLFGLGVVAFGSLLSLVLENPTAVKYLPTFLNGALPVEFKTWMSVLVVAYLGSYLFIIRELLRALANFELTPRILLSAAIHVLFGAITAVIIAATAIEIFPVGTLTSAVVLIAAFAVGFVPELGLRTLLRASRLSAFKREETNIHKAFPATPLEVLDGIDSGVRSRLALHNITTVQHLAAANPILLFVETPYGVYQIIDWVAQAQLCSALGAKTITNLWDLGIRTIFDLERVVFATTSNITLRHEVGKIIASGRNEAERARLGLADDSAASRATDRTVITLATMLLSGLHIHRLRQIVNCIAERLGSENLALIHLKAVHLDNRKCGKRGFQPNEPQTTHSNELQPRRQRSPVASIISVRG